METRVIPADWPLASLMLPHVAEAAGRLGLDGRLAAIVLVADAIATDDRSWLRFDGDAGARRLTIWFHPDQVVNDRPGRGRARPESQAWDLGPLPAESPPAAAAEYSLANAMRFLYQQFLLARDLLDGALAPANVPPSLVEAFQEAWLTTIDGRLNREGLPHLSAAERRLSFLRLFARAGVLTPSHWAIFNDLWEGRLADQSAVLAKVRLLPPLGRRRGA